MNTVLMHRLLYILTCGLLIQAHSSTSIVNSAPLPSQPTVCQSKSPNFLVMGGGGAPSYNEIALEKNVLYFQRTLKFLGYDSKQAASTFFANGNNGEATIRYIDDQEQERFKAPEIPNLSGASTLNNLQGYFQQITQQNSTKPLFFYFTGHGGRNTQDLNNNSLYLWNEQQLSVKQLAQLLDQTPRQTPVVTMMAQCFSGSFANFIYEGGDPKRPVALQTRCGFFATIKTQPSVGCTPEVNEADYRDYSSSFFAGLSGRNRIGQKVASADYNKDRKTSYAEAHAFAKVDEKTIDLPVSTSEVWLQNKVSEPQQEAILSQPIDEVVQKARPEQLYVVNSLTKMFSLDGQKSFSQNLENLSTKDYDTLEQEAYLKRLEMELLNIGSENQLRASKNEKDLATLERLLKCEGSSWAQP